MEFITADNITYFYLVFIRVLTIIVLLPVLGYEGIDMKVKVLFSFLTSILLFPYAVQVPLEMSGNLGLFVGYTLNEIVAGLIIGFLPIMIFVGFQYAGELMSMQMGLSMMQMMDPTTQSNISVMGRLKYIFLMMIFLFMGGHLFFIEAIGKSFELIPLGHIAYDGFAGVVQIVIRNIGDILVIGIKAGAPVVISLFVIEAGLGILSRTVPQMNIFLVAVPLKIGAGLIIFLAVVGYVVKLFIQHYGILQNDMLNIIKLLGIGF